MFNCSQTKFVAIILVLLFFLCDFLLDQFFVWPICVFVLKNGIKRLRTLSSLRAFALTIMIHRNCFETYLWRDMRFLRIDHSTPISPRPLSQSPPLYIVQAVRAPCSQRSPSHRSPTVESPPVRSPQDLSIKLKLASLNPG